ncbi:hypothetical protein EJD97_017574 [Solanum chilense]|uniref:Cation-transporting P-type ATPase C-terminal domain-containing protein n=1 Tax=Solanum chilense TaxID=4083 RepID=A0A6N2AHN2_SOLCI|nr:hypothetical protein EJD97_017574 [Solanum chilense]
MTVCVVALIINFISACISGSAPFTAVQLLWVNLIMDTLGAIALATEPPHEELMNRPPVGREVRLISKTMWRNIIGQSIFQLAIQRKYKLKTLNSVSKLASYIALEVQLNIHFPLFCHETNLERTYIMSSDKVSSN